MNNIRFPKGERIWVGYYSEERNLMFILTTKEANRDFYFLYELTNGEFKRLGKSRSPLELEEKHKVSDRLRGAGR